jgi:hypothetical protein
VFRIGTQLKFCITLRHIAVYQFSRRLMPLCNKNRNCRIIVAVKNVIPTSNVLKAARMKTIVFWDVAPCCLAEVYRRFRCSKDLRNVCKLPPYYTAQYPRRRSPLHSSPSCLACPSTSYCSLTSSTADLSVH